MKNFTLTLLTILFAAQSFGQQACTYSDLGTNATYTLADNEVLCITAGTFTGVIQSLPNNASIQIAQGATFNPSAIFNASGLIKNSGTVLFNSTNSLADGFSIVNDSAALVEINVAQSLGGAFNLTNDRDGDVLINTSLTLQNGSNFSNEGIVRCNASFSADNSTVFGNDGVMFVYGNFSVSGIAYNGGIMKVFGYSTMDNSSTFINKCTFLSENTITNNSSKFENYGYIQVFSSDSTNASNRLVNNKEFYNDENAIVQTTMFDNNANVIGGGTFIALGETQNNGSFGYDGGGINFYDASPTGNQFFDEQSIQPHVSVSRLSVGSFDTNYISTNCNKMAFPLSPNATLPVILNSINAVNRECTPVIEWSTSQEINSNYFEIERKAEQENGFKKVGTVQSQVNSSIATNYTFNDEHLENGKYQYRLKMIDLDGQFSYSRVVSLNMFCGSETSVNLYPNPSNSSINITMNTNDNDTYNVIIVDMMGRRLYQSVFDFNSGMNTIQLPVHYLANGQYSVMITNSIKSETIKFTKN
jgi:hypothetical protein